MIASAVTVPGAPNNVTPFMTPPTADHVWETVSQRATPLTLIPPALSKYPPKYTSVPDTTTAFTCSYPSDEVMPLPNACQATPSQSATLVAATPPASLKLPTA